MSSKLINKLESPMKLTKEAFINGCEDDHSTQKKSNLESKPRSRMVNFTLYSEDLIRLENQIDRSIKLKIRSKNRSALIRMALAALENCSDIEYIKLHEKF